MTKMRDEHGFAVATAIIVMTIMLMFGLAMMAMVDNQTQQSGRERVKETAYNVAEATLSSEVFAMAKPWPGTADGALSDCTRASASARCPSATSLAQGFQGTEFSGTTGWTVTVRDNLGSAGTYYRRSVVDSTPCATVTGGSAAPCTWDSNADGLLWVRAQATVAGRTRTIVTLARQQQVGVTLPANSVLAGKFATTNNGKKVIVDEQGCYAPGTPAGQCLSDHSAAVAVRCPPPGGVDPSPSNTCLGYDPNKGQLDPDTYVTGFQGINVNCPNNYANCAMTSDDLDGFKRRALADKTYYGSTCPTNLTGAVVFIDNPPGGICTYNGGTGNTAQKPGMVIVNHGKLTLEGNITFYGIVYATNLNPTPTNADPDIIKLGGRATVQGAIIVEGPGGTLAGSDKVNIIYDPNAASSLYGYGDNAVIAQNSYRELPAGQ